MNQNLIKAAMLVAGPTTGKSSLTKSLRANGVTVLETDEVIEEFMPFYFKDKLWNITDPDRPYINRMKDIFVGYNISMTFEQKFAIMSNLWSPDFLDQFLLPGKFPLYIFRANALEITELSKARGTAIPTQLAAKWINSTEQHWHKRFDHVLWLPDNLFLSDVVSWELDKFTLTEKGRELIDKSRTAILELGKV